MRSSTPASESYAGVLFPADRDAHETCHSPICPCEPVVMRTRRSVRASRELPPHARWPAAGHCLPSTEKPIQFVRSLLRKSAGPEPARRMKTRASSACRSTASKSSNVMGRPLRMTAGKRAPDGSGNNHDARIFSRFPRSRRAVFTRTRAGARDLHASGALIHHALGEVGAPRGQAVPPKQKWPASCGPFSSRIR